MRPKVSSGEEVCGMRSTRNRRGAVSVALGVALAGLLPSTTATAAPKVVVCTAAGRSASSRTHRVRRPTSGRSSRRDRVSATNKGTYFVDVTAIGSSDSLGQCDEIGFVMNLELKATVTMTSTTDAAFSKLFTEDWFARSPRSRTWCRSSTRTTTSW